MGKTHPLMFAGYDAGVFFFGCRLDCGDIFPIFCAVVVMEFMSPDPLAFWQEMALLFQKLHIAKTNQLPSVGAGSGKNPRHGMADAFLVCDGGVEIHKSTAFCHQGHILARRLPDGGLDALVSAKAFCVKLWVSAANQ